MRIQLSQKTACINQWDSTKIALERIHCQNEQGDVSMSSCRRMHHHVGCCVSCLGGYFESVDGIRVGKPTKLEFNLGFANNIKRLQIIAIVGLF